MPVCVALAWLLFLAYAWAADAVEGASAREWFDAGVGFVLFGLVPASIVRVWAVSLDRGDGLGAKTAAAA